MASLVHPPRLFFGVMALVVLVALILQGDQARASAPVELFETVPSTTQAGGHPDVRVTIKVGDRQTQGFPEKCFCNDPKDISAELPAGVIGNPHVTPQCTAADLAENDCPIDSQVGVAAVLLYAEPEVGGVYFYTPLYNTQPHPGQAGLLTFETIAGPQFVVLSARTGGDYGLTSKTVGIERFVPVHAITQYLWGVPASPTHDYIRDSGCGLLTENFLPALNAGEIPAGCSTPKPVGSSSPELPFMTNPTACTGPLTSSVETLSYDHGTDRGQTSYPPITGCNQLAFNPSLSAEPTTSETDSPSGLDIDLKVPQFTSPTTPSPSQIKATTVTLPVGFSLNPNAADGKAVCSDGEASFGTEAAAHCPEFAKVGTLSIDSSALPGPIDGYVYLGEPKPGDRYRLILTADGFATHVKLAGSLSADPVTGQLVTRLENLPQSPLTEFKLHFFGSERSSLVTPTQCGTYSVKSTFTPWADGVAEQDATQFFSLDSGPGGSPCPPSPRPFSPTVSAASQGNTAGAHSPFFFSLVRNDGDQILSGLTIKTPPGFSATLRGVDYCPESAIATLGTAGYPGLAEQVLPSCPAASQVGTAVAGAGAGTRPLFVGGKVYLAGPYKGAPLSLETVIPAVSGPYDLGVVAVRAAVYVNPLTAQVTTVADPLPQILEGVPLRTRMIRVSLDRNDFALNPTNCGPLSVGSQIFGGEGGVANLNTGYQVANCANLQFEPRLSLTLSGGLRRLGHPVIHSVVETEPGEANLKRIVVTLPRGELLDNSHIGSICTKGAFATNSCPAGSKLGSAEVTSPLLDSPLKGAVYLRSSQNGLPDLALDLEGQLDIEAIGRIDSTNERYRATFNTIPDVPIGRIVFNLAGGRKGLLQNSKSLCGVSKEATVQMTGQNGMRYRTHSGLHASCGKGSGRRRARVHHLKAVR